MDNDFIDALSGCESTNCPPPTCALQKTLSARGTNKETWYFRNQSVSWGWLQVVQSKFIFLRNAILPTLSLRERLLR